MRLLSRLLVAALLTLACKALLAHPEDEFCSGGSGLYVRLGFEHILPGGLDHILFVVALFLASTRFRPLLIQVSVFTLAHTFTLGLAVAGCRRATEPFRNRY